MQIRCYKCHMSYSLSNEEMGFAVAALRQAGEVHYDSPCERCRTKNRVSLEQLEKEVRRRGIEIPPLDKGTTEAG
jgi:hypothetical protein